jgi:hypothetical protein
MADRPEISGTPAVPPIDPRAVTTAGQVMSPTGISNPQSNYNSWGPIPVLSSGMTFREIGQSGLRQFSGWIREEFLQSLIGRQGAQKYREMMDNSPTIGALLFSMQSTMRKVEWRVMPSDDGGGGQESADFVESCMHDMSISWTDFVGEALSMLPFGYCLPGSQVVTMANGRPRRADQVRVGDEVLTKEGRGRKVLHVFRRSHDDLITRIRVRGYPFPIYMTPNHEVITEMGWQRAGDLSAGQMLLRPRPRLSAGGDYASGWLVGLYLAEGSRDKAGRRTRIEFSLHDKECDDVAAILSKWIESHNLARHHHLSKLSPQIMRGINGTNGGRVLFSHPELFSLIERWVDGDDSKNKALRMLPQDEDFARGIHDGWMYGDGHHGVDSRFASDVVQGATVSEHLGRQMQLIAGALGLPSPLSYSMASDLTPGISGKVRSGVYVVGGLEPREIRWKRKLELENRVRILRASGMAMQTIAAECDLSYLTVWRWLHTDGPKNQGLQCRVLQSAIGHEIIEVGSEHFVGDVFDFEVDEDHTYCAGPFVIHNSFHELVYKRRLGREPGPDKTRPIGGYGSSQYDDLPISEYDDGKVGWRRLPGRSQDTIIKWFFDENGQVKGVTQQPWVGPLIDIPIEKSLLFRPIHYKNNPEGRSIIRNAYLPYYYAKRMQEQEAILAERLGGVPVLKIPGQVIEAAAAGDAAATAALNQYKRIAVNLRIDEQMGLVLPSDPYPGNNGPSSVGQYQFELVTPGMSRGAALDFDKTITRYNLSIFTSVLADFLTLGHEARGTQSLAVSKIDLFFQAVEGYLNSMAGVLNRFAIPRLWKLNGFDADSKPEIVPDLAQRVDLDVLSNFILRLSQAGMPLFPDDELQSYIKDAAGLPDVTDDRALQAAGMSNEQLDRDDEKDQATLDRLQNPPQPAPVPGGPPQPGRTNLEKMILASAARRQQRFAGPKFGVLTKRARRPVRGRTVVVPSAHNRFDAGSIPAPATK